jgi:methylated-DNA-protein-cysteine methyltransferase-like protein
LGSGKSSRLVGYAMNLSHKHDHLIPAHRVVNRKGLLTGKMHFNDPDEMQRLLEKEGINIKDDQILNFQSHLWDPAILAEEL